MASSKKIISGAALGTLLGSLAAIMYPKRQEIMENLMDRAEDISNLTEKAREYGKFFNFRRQESKANYVKGGLIGFFIGASAALMMAPKSGKSLRGQLTRAYNDLSERSEEFVHHFKNGAHNPFAQQHRTSQNGMKKKKPAAKARKAHH